MLIRHKRPGDLTENDVTPERLYLNRRAIMRGMAAAGAGAVVPWGAAQAAYEDIPGEKLDYVKGPYRTDEKLTPYESVTTYNNFYEFGTGKEDPSENADTLKTEPWTVEVEGHAHNTGKYSFDDLVDPQQLEERIYRLRCVEAWSMVIPWVGFPLNKVIERLEPTSDAKFVQFVTLHDPDQMPGQDWPVLDWPYVEGLRMDEAMHPLTLLTVGVYGRVLPNQNGAPIRLVVPWKYGFKSIKSIVKIRFVSEQPETAWNKAAPNEYGFYSNVNPNVDHPRWSQKTERRIGGGGLLSLFERRDTQMFNGYEEEVAHLYKGMDLKKHF